MIYKWEPVDLIFDKYNDTIIKKLFSKFKNIFMLHVFRLQGDIMSQKKKDIRRGFFNYSMIKYKQT